MSFLYVMSNKSMPGIVKIGVTSRDPQERATDLHTTGTPTPFIVEYYALFGSYVWEAEKKAHNKLDSCRVSGNREFFNISVNNAVDAIKSLRLPYKDIYKRLGEENIELVENQISQEIQNRKKIAQYENFVDECINLKDSIKEKQQCIDNLSENIDIANNSHNDEDTGFAYLVLTASFVLGFIFPLSWLVTALFLFSLIMSPISEKKLTNQLIVNKNSYINEKRILEEKYNNNIAKEIEYRYFLYNQYVKMRSELPGTEYNKISKINTKFDRYGLSDGEIKTKKALLNLKSILDEIDNGKNYTNLHKKIVHEISCFLFKNKFENIKTFYFYKDKYMRGRAEIIRHPVNKDIKKFKPDITASRNGLDYIFVLFETCDYINNNKTEDRLKTFYNYCKHYEKIFIIIVPIACYQIAKERITELGISDTARLWSKEKWLSLKL